MSKLRTALLDQPPLLSSTGKREHLNGKEDELLEAECRLAGKGPSFSPTAPTHGSLRGHPHVHGVSH